MAFAFKLNDQSIGVCLSILSVALLYTYKYFDDAIISINRNILSDKDDAKLLSISDVELVINQMEYFVQKDEGNRGIQKICLPSGELYKSALEVIANNNKTIAIITGFPCMLDYTPPTETDGPLGAIAIAKALLLLNKKVILLTDECNEEVVLACAAGIDIDFKLRQKNLVLESFPPANSFDEQDQQRFEKYYETIDLVIAIERSGPNKDGQYLTMRGKNMSHLIAPLDRLLLPCSDGEITRPRSIGIGDGGNEVGMGKVYSKIIESTIPNAKEIACVVPSDHLIVCSVSNWGGYALSAAIGAAVTISSSSILSSGNTCDSVITKQALRGYIKHFLPTNEEEINKCSRMVEAGARDGVTGKQGMYVDGMPFEEDSLRVLDSLRNII